MRIEISSEPRRGSARSRTDDGLRMERLLIDQSLVLEAKLPGKELPVRANPDRTFQVLLNLLSNAIRITPRGGQISVTAARQERRVQIAVRDTGEGSRRPTSAASSIPTVGSAAARATDRGSGSSSRRPSSRRTVGESGPSAGWAREAHSSLPFPAPTDPGWERPIPARLRRVNRALRVGWLPPLPSVLPRGRPPTPGFFLSFARCHPPCVSSPSLAICFVTAAASSEMKGSICVGSTVLLTPAQTSRSCSSE